jgi:hypothetical protein
MLIGHDSAKEYPMADHKRPTMAKLGLLDSKEGLSVRGQ